MAEGPQLSRAYVAERRKRSKDIFQSIKLVSRGSGWRRSRETLFRETEGWFYAVRSCAHLNDDVTSAALFYKPMAIDPLFWEITGLPANNDEPLSFRAHGAWTCTTPDHKELRIADGEASADTVASEILRWADAAYSELSPAVSVSSLIEEIEAAHLRVGLRGFFATQVCALILSGQIEKARAECEDAVRRGDEGGFSVAFGPTFPEMAIDWIDRRTAGGAGAALAMI